MAKEELLEMDGTVLERLPDARYRVRLDNGHETMAYMEEGTAASANSVVSRNAQWP